jgi:hypothetical protein
MFTKATFALLLTAGLLTNGAFAAEGASRAPRMTGSEVPIETNTFALPALRAVPGAINLRPCDQCAPVTLSVTTSSQFFLGSRPVSYADLHAFAQRSSANVVVFYDSKTNAVTRIVVSGVR